MNADKLEQIEIALSIELPRHYFQFQIDYPKLLKDTVSPGFNEPISGREIQSDSRRLIRLNQLARETGGFEKCFVIGDDANGNFWAISLEDHFEKVFFYDGKSKALKPVAESMDEFKERLLKTALKPKSTPEDKEACTLEMISGWLVEELDGDLAAEEKAELKKQLIDDIVDLKKTEED